MTDVALSLLDGIAALPLWALALVVALAVTAESSLFVGLVVPGDIIVLLAASGGASPQRIVLLILAVAAGSVAGEAIGYGIGRRWGGRVRASRLGRALGEARWDKAADVLQRHGARAVFGARYVAALHAVLPVLAGTLEMPRRRFLSWSTAGALSWATLYVGAGAAAGASFRRAAEHLTTVTLVVAGLAAVVATLAHVRSARRTRRAAESTVTTTASFATACTALAASGAATGTTARTAGNASATGTYPCTVVPAPSAAGDAVPAVERTDGAPGGTAHEPSAQIAGGNENGRWGWAPTGEVGGNGGRDVPVRIRDVDGAGSGVRAAAAPPPAFVACCGCGCDDRRSSAA